LGVLGGDADSPTTPGLEIPPFPWEFTEEGPQMKRFANGSVTKVFPFGSLNRNLLYIGADGAI